MKLLFCTLALLTFSFLSPSSAKAADSPPPNAGQLSTQKTLVIQRGTLIDATGRPPIEDAVIVIRGVRIEAVGKRGEVPVPRGARVIDASGKTILPGLIDGHCHLRDFMGELYLHLGITTCPDISQNEDYWVSAIKDGTDLGKIRGPRIWATGKRILGEPPAWGRRVGFGYLVKTPEEARRVVREKKQMGMEIIKLNEFVTPEVLKAAADEANRLGLPVTCHCIDVLLAAEAGVTGVEHHWAPGMTSILDPKKRWKVHEERNAGKFDTPELPFYYEAENFDAVIKVMIEKNVSYSATIATHFRPLSPSAAVFKARELAILNDPKTKYFPPFLRWQTDDTYRTYETMPAEQLNRVKEGYRKVEDFMRRYVKAGGVLRTGSDPNNIMPAIGIHIEMKMFVEAGLTPMQAIQASTINVAKTFRKDKDFGTVEPGKVADLVIIDGDPLKDIWTTQNVRRVILNGNEVDISFHAAYKNPIPNTRADERVPDITEILPVSIAQGSGAVKLKVQARRGFEPYFRVTLDGKEIPTRFINERELEATIPAEITRKAGTYTVMVVNPGDFAARSSLAYLIVRFGK